MFEEADGIWINLQGKDRQKRLEKQKEKCKKENKEFNPKMKVKTELKLHVMYEGWKKDDSRHALINTKQYNKIQAAIEELKYEVGGEYTAVKKLNKLQSYLSNGLERYQDKVEVPEAPEGIEYRNMGTQESQIFSKLEKRFCSGRKAFSEHGANALAKVCVLSEKFSLEEIETPIPIDTSVEDWIKEIEKNVKANKKINRANKVLTEENNISNKILIGTKFMKDIMRLREFSEMRCSF